MKEDVTVSCGDVRAALTELSLVVAVQHTPWEMRKLLGRMITKRPAILSPMREPRKNDQEALDKLAASLGGSVGESRFGKNYHRYLEYRWRNVRSSAAVVLVDMEENETNSTFSLCET